MPSTYFMKLFDSPISPPIIGVMETIESLKELLKAQTSELINANARIRTLEAQSSKAMKQPKPFPAGDAFTEARCEVLDINEDLGQLCSELRFGAEFAHEDMPANAKCKAEDAQTLIGEIRVKLAKMERIIAQWQGWAEEATK